MFALKTFDDVHERRIQTLVTWLDALGCEDFNKLHDISERLRRTAMLEI